VNPSSKLTVSGLLEVFLDVEAHPWRRDAEVIVGYMPPYPHPDTKPTTVVCWHGSFLRYSHGPRQGYFWDLYGDDMYSEELAWLALSKAPPHPRVLYAGVKAVKDVECLEPSR
jgi:hypothetical protein